MKRLTREESKIRTKELLLRAAKQEFARVGYGGTTADLIAERAGFSKGAFYAHFETKEAIFLELLKGHVARESAVLSELVSKSLDTEEILKGINAWFAEMQKDADWALLSIELRLFAKRNPSFGKSFVEIQKNHRKELGKLLKKIFDDADKKIPEKPELLAGALMALAHGLELVRIETDESVNFSGKATTLFLQGLLSLGKDR